MNNNINIFLDKNSMIHISGYVSLYNCMYLKKKCYDHIKKLNSISINLKDLRSDDSSIILLILNLIKISQPKKIIFFNISYSIKKILKSYKIDNIFSKYFE